MAAANLYYDSKFLEQLVGCTSFPFQETVSREKFVVRLANKGYLGSQKGTADMIKHFLITAQQDTF
jgi:hypothetical protein